MSPRRREGPRLRKNGYYYLDQTIGFGAARRRVMISLGTTDPHLARALWKKERARLWDSYYGGASGVPVGPVYFSALITPYAEFCRDVRKASSWSITRARLLTVSRAWGEYAMLSEITPGHIAALEKHLATLARRRAPATINHYVKAIRAYYNWAIDQGYFSGRNPMRSVKPYPVDSRRRAYTSDEMRRIVEAAGRIADDARPQDEIMRQARRLVLLLYYTGMRLGEVLNLRWDSIQLDRIQLGRTETKQRREKVVPITAPVADVLRELEAERRDEYVLPLRRRSGGVYRSDWANGLLRRIRADSGVGDFLFHGLRHTASTLMAARIGRGATLADVMRVLGHSRPDTTLRYTHTDNERMAAALASIPEIGYNAPVDAGPLEAGNRAVARQSTRRKTKAADNKRD